MERLGQCPLAQPVLEPLLLLQSPMSQAWPPHQGSGPAQQHQCGVPLLSVSEHHSSRVPSSWAGQGPPASIPGQAGAQLLHLSPGSVHRRVLLCLAALLAPASASLQAYRDMQLLGLHCGRSYGHYCKLLNLGRDIFCFLRSVYLWQEYSKDRSICRKPLMLLQEGKESNSIGFIAYSRHSS